MNKNLQTFQASFGLFLAFIPLILMVITQEVRPSISNYAYSNQSNVFVSLLTLAGTVFIVDGWLREKHYNIVLGLALIGVSLTPHLDYPIAHYTCAGVFFLGSVYTMIAFSSAKQRVHKMIAGAVIIVALAIALITDIISLLYAEWLGILPITLHYVGEAYGIID